MFHTPIARYSLFVLKVPLNTNQPNIVSATYHVSHSAAHLLVLSFEVLCYAALLPRRGPHIASHSVCLSVRPVRGCTLFTFAPSYERTSKIEKLRFSLMGQRHVCTFRHAQRAAYRTAISAAQILVILGYRNRTRCSLHLTFDICILPIYL